MFLGQYDLNFSGQGRLVLPKKFREQISRDQEIILSRGLDGCIWGFSKKEWEIEAQKQLEIPIIDQKGRDLRRYLFSAAEVVGLDDQSRFVIPKVLLNYAQLTSSVIMVGAGDHFEIWNPKRWGKLIKQFERGIN